MDTCLPEQKVLTDKEIQHAKMWALRRANALLKYKGISPTPENREMLRKSELKLNNVDSR